MDLRQCRKEIAGQVRDGTPVAIVEAMASQLLAMRQARELIDADGVMVRDGKQNPISHPCLDLERKALAALSELMRSWGKR